MKPTHTRYWVVVFALALAMIMYIQRVAISAAIVPIAADLHLNKAQTGVVLGAFGLSYALFEIPMGLMGDRLGVRWVLTQVVLLWSLFTALTGAAWNMASLWAIRFLFGAGEAGCFPNLTRMLSAWLPLSERVKAQAVMWAFGRWGGALAPPVAICCHLHVRLASGLCRAGHVRRGLGRAVPALVPQRSGAAQRRQCRRAGAAGRRARAGAA